VLTVAADAAASDDIQAAVDACVARFGRLDVVVAAAGALDPGATLPQATPDAAWEASLANNLTSAFRTARAAHPHLAASGTGRLLLVSSIAGGLGFASQTGYCSAKAGVRSLAKSLALAWAGDGIAVNALLPGPTDTGFTDAVFQGQAARRAATVAGIPAGRLGTPGDFVGPALFLCGPGAASFTTGADVVVDGGTTARGAAPPVEGGEKGV
jgi:2-deoxy-D-gluconate 3-dehydrogenase